jgi:hypothetical protein
MATWRAGVPCRLRVPIHERGDHHRQIHVRTARDKAFALAFVQDKEGTAALYWIDGEASRAALIFGHRITSPWCDVYHKNHHLRESQSA